MLNCVAGRGISSQEAGEPPQLWGRPGNERERLPTNPRLWMLNLWDAPGQRSGFLKNIPGRPRVCKSFDLPLAMLVPWAHLTCSSWLAWLRISGTVSSLDRPLLSPGPG